MVQQGTLEQCSLEALEQRAVSSDFRDREAVYAFEQRYKQLIKLCSVDELFEKLRAPQCTTLQRSCILTVLREDHYIFVVAYKGEEPTPGEIAYAILDESHCYPGLDEQGNPRLGLGTRQPDEGALRYFLAHVEEMREVLAERHARKQKFHETKVYEPWLGNYAYYRLAQAPW